ATSRIADDREANIEHFKADAGGAAATAELTRTHKLVLGAFFLAFLTMIVGVIPWSDLGIYRIPTHFWWFAEMTASFLFFSIVIVCLARMSEAQLPSSFVDGASDLLGVALILGKARGVTVI